MRFKGTIFGVMVIYILLNAVNVKYSPYRVYLCFVADDKVYNGYNNLMFNIIDKSVYIVSFLEH